MFSSPFCLTTLYTFCLFWRTAPKKQWEPNKKQQLSPPLWHHSQLRCLFMPWVVSFFWLWLASINTCGPTVLASWSPLCRELVCWCLWMFSISNPWRIVQVGPAALRFWLDVVSACPRSRGLIGDLDQKRACGLLFSALPNLEMLGMMLEQGHTVES